MNVLIEGFPLIAGGMMISSAMVLNSRYAKLEAEPKSSLYGMLSFDSQSKWKSSFIAGILFASCLMANLYGFNEVENTHIKPFETDKLFFKGTGILQFMFSGFLLGLGAKLAMGGLNKYALYGMPRFNRQSLFLVGTVLLFGMITSTMRSTFPILQGVNISKKFNEILDFRLSLFIPIVMLFFNLATNYNNMGALKDILRSFGIGNLLAAGMMASGLARRHQMLDFLSLNSRWSPFLLFVVLGAILGNMFMTRMFKFGPSVQEAPLVPALTPLMLIGCSLFGIGLGISGLTPGAGLLVSPIYMPQIVLFFLPFIIAGQIAGGYVQRFTMGSQKLLKTQ